MSATMQERLLVYYWIVFLQFFDDLFYCKIFLFLLFSNPPFKKYFHCSPIRGLVKIPVWYPFQRSFFFFIIWIDFNIFSFSAFTRWLWETILDEIAFFVYFLLSFNVLLQKINFVSTFINLLLQRLILFSSQQHYFSRYHLFFVVTPFRRCWRFSFVSFVFASCAVSVLTVCKMTTSFEDEYMKMMWD